MSLLMSSLYIRYALKPPPPVTFLWSWYDLWSWYLRYLLCSMKLICVIIEMCCYALLIIVNNFNFFVFSNPRCDGFTFNLVTRRCSHYLGVGYLSGRQLIQQRDVHFHALERCDGVTPPPPTISPPGESVAIATVVYSNQACYHGDFLFTVTRHACLP